MCISVRLFFSRLTNYHENSFTSLLSAMKTFVNCNLALPCYGEIIKNINFVTLT